MYKAGSVEYDAAAGAAGAGAGAAGSGAGGSLGVAILSGPGMGAGKSVSGRFVWWFPEVVRCRRAAEGGWQCAKRKGSGQVGPK